MVHRAGIRHQGDEASELRREPVDTLRHRLWRTGGAPGR